MCNLRKLKVRKLSSDKSFFLLHGQPDADALVSLKAVRTVKHFFRLPGRDGTD